MKARGNRDRVIIASKVGFQMPDGAGLSAAQIAYQVENSLRRLQIETIDLYYAHRDDRSVPLEETLEAFEKLVRDGKVRYLGASNYRPWRLMKALGISRQHGWAEYQCIQQRHTFLRPEPDAKFVGGNQIVLDNDLLDLCAEETITILAYSVLLSGAYTRSDRSREGYLTPVNERRLARLKVMAADMGISPNTLILAWMLHGQPAIIPLIAASTEAQLQENLRACEVTLTAEQMAALNEGLPA
jgi:aryl-alcohol dehydrogenase-like predicted oxidoreductase